jgi:hypothetical protein
MKNIISRLLLCQPLLFVCCCLFAQSSLKLKYNNSTVQAGIEVGSKGVKLSVLEIGKNAKSSGAFNILKDSSVNTDFISFSQPSFQATLNGLYNLYMTATRDYKIPSSRVFTVVSSGVKVQAEKDGKTSWINNLIDSFKLRTKESQRQVEIVDVMQEARLSHLGIVPESKRFTTFLIDIGSGNTKGGYFRNSNLNQFKLFQLSWGTKSTANATDKRCEDDKSLINFNRQLFRVLQSAENSEIIYAVNESGSYPASDIIAISGGIAWSVATLLHPELIDNSIVPVTFNEVTKFSEKLYSDSAAFFDKAIIKTINDKSLDNVAIAKEIKRVHSVFDQRSLMAGTGLLLKIMRQFEGIYERKEFFLVKNGQVGWISAYVDQNTIK